MLKREFSTQTPNRVVPVPGILLFEMGRTKSAGTVKGAKKASPGKISSTPPSVPALLAKAQSLMGELDFDLARKFVVRILETEPDHFEAREMLAIIEVEKGDVDVARNVSRAFRFRLTRFDGLSKVDQPTHSYSCHWSLRHLQLNRPPPIPLISISPN
jgi:hypothetical protein